MDCPSRATSSELTRRHLLGAAAGSMLVPTVLAVPAHATTGTGERAVQDPLGPPGPVIWTTDAMLERAEQRVANQKDPFYTAWLRTLDQAERVIRARLDGSLAGPYQGPDQNTYSLRGRAQSRYARDLAIAHRVTGEKRFLDEAKLLLHRWARDAIDYPYPDPPLGFHAYPGSNLPHGSGLRIGRIIPKFADAYAMVSDEMTTEERTDVEEWMRLMIPPILESQRIWREEDRNQEAPYLGQQYFNNHLTAQTLGIAAVGFALQDQELITLALNSPHNPRDLKELIDGVILMPGDIGSGEEGDLHKDDPTLTQGMPEPLPGEIYDRYRVNGNRGMFYSLLNLRLLTNMAEMTHNNSRSLDYYDYVGPNGENLEISFEVYSPWWITGQASSVNSPYYDAEQIDPGFDRIANDRINHEFSTWELAFRQYRHNEVLETALRAWDRVVFDAETWGWTAVLTHGVDLDEPEESR